MGFWNSLFGGETNPEEEKRVADERNFDLLKYDGVKAMRIGKFDYAVKCFEKALETKDDPEVHDYLSRAFIRLGRLDDALAELKMLAMQEPDNIGLKMQAASIAFMKEDYDEMKALCEQALAVDANNAMAHLFYAKAELGQEHLIEGVARLTKVITLEERLVEPRQLRGQTLLKMGDLKGALEDAQWLLRYTRDNEDAMLLIARILAKAGQADKAIIAYGKVIEMNPFSVDAFRERGKLRLDSGDKQGAEEDMKMVLELNPEEVADVSGEYSAEGIEHKTRQAYSNLNPFGI
ncbi:MAG: tetratricopeptide repeat protein [Prevotella sp.]|nr:tetratricopeptide repeat protein [Prevotella sp.]